MPSLAQSAMRSLVWLPLGGASSSASWLPERTMTSPPCFRAAACRARRNRSVDHIAGHHQYRIARAPGGALRRGRLRGDNSRGRKKPNGPLVIPVDVSDLPENVRLLPLNDGRILRPAAGIVGAGPCLRGREESDCGCDRDRSQLPPSRHSFTLPCGRDACRQRDHCQRGVAASSAGCPGRTRQRELPGFAELMEDVLELQGERVWPVDEQKEYQRKRSRYRVKSPVQDSPYAGWHPEPPFRAVRPCPSS